MTKLYSFILILFLFVLGGCFTSSEVENLKEFTNACNGKVTISMTISHWGNTVTAMCEGYISKDNK